MDAKVPEELLSCIKGDYEGFQSRLRELPYEYQNNEITVSGKFFYLPFRDGQPTLDEFVNYIRHLIIPFCIPRREIKKADEKYEATRNPRHITEIDDKARRLFVKAKESQRTTGEAGELILFMLLEAALSAPQIACKMYLKTSQNVSVHGSDSIHIMRGTQESSLCLVWGESKIYKQLSSALDEVCSSIISFLGNNDGSSPRERDINVITDHIDIIDENWKQLLLNYFDPYCEQSNLREESFACFIGFDFSAYTRLDEKPISEREAFFQEAYLQRIETACQLFSEKLSNSRLTNLRINYFLIPFPNVDDFRGKFLSAIG
jgi:hypothetical protein